MGVLNGRIFHSFGDEKTKRIVIGIDYRLSELKKGHWTFILVSKDFISVFCTFPDVLSKSVNHNVTVTVPFLNFGACSYYSIKNLE